MYDDLDLPFTKLRLPPKGGHGGHNGYFNSLHVFSQQLCIGQSISLCDAVMQTVYQRFHDFGGRC
jgi:peptidyl-tRNA hydrolase